MSEDAPDDPLETAWKALLDDWESPERHRAFVGLAVSFGRLPDAAKLYREQMADESRKPRAKEGIDRILAVAMQSLGPVEREARTPPGRWIIPVMVLGLILMLTTASAQVLGNKRLASPWVLIGEAAIVFLIPWGRFLKRE